MEIVKYQDKYYDEVNDIYNESFPVEEHYMPLKDMVKAETSELYCLVDDDKVLGYTYTIRKEDSVFVLYLAISSDCRSKGYGSELLQWVINNYKDCGVFLNIDELDKNKPDFKTRERRLNFYLRNGMKVTDIMSLDIDENFHVLSNREDVDFEKYKRLDDHVSKVLEAENANVVLIKGGFKNTYGKYLGKQDTCREINM